MLVNHSKPISDRIPIPNVKFILDHRIRANRIPNFPQKNLRVQTDASSCSTLVARAILNRKHDSFIRVLKLLHQVIVYKVGVDYKKQYKNDWEVIYEIERLTRKLEFEQLLSAKYNPAGLTPKQLLRKDSKVIDNNRKNHCVHVPFISMPLDVSCAVTINLAKL